MNKKLVLKIAEVCHEANRAWCAANGDTSQVSWSEAPEWQRISSIEAVVWRLKNPSANYGKQHDQWMAEKVENGWVFGEVKDADKKTHPMLVPFEQLPEVEKKKDYLITAVILALG